MMTEQEGRAEMVRRIKEALAHPQDEPVWIEMPVNVGWVPCPCCQLPMMHRVLLDTRTGKGVGECCGKWGLRKISREVS